MWIFVRRHCVPLYDFTHRTTSKALCQAKNKNPILSFLSDNNGDNFAWVECNTLCISRRSKCAHTSDLPMLPSPLGRERGRVPRIGKSEVTVKMGIPSDKNGYTLEGKWACPRGEEGRPDFSIKWCGAFFLRVAPVMSFSPQR